VIALVQNGLRVEDPNSLPVPRKSLAHRPKVDFYFCFNSSIGDFVSKSLDATYVSIGSFRSNHEPRISISPSENISYISTFRTDIPLTSLISTSNHGESLTYGSILELRIQILIEVATFCDENGLRLELLGKDLDHNADESFYRERLGKFQFSYIPRTAGSFQYLQCDTAKIVVSTGSTLGLESLARGNRTAVFDPLPLILGNPSFQFGWPMLIDPEGPFWSTQASPPRIRQILGSLLSASDEQWKQTLDTYRDALPYYDPANTVFVNQLSEYGARMIPSDKTPDILR
jgi:surface carbohydrate biosynthesis protein